MNPLRMILCAAGALVGFAGVAAAQVPAAPDQPVPVGARPALGQPVMDKTIFIHGLLD